MHLRIVVQHGFHVPHGLKQGDDVKEAVILTDPVQAVGSDIGNTVSVRVTYASSGVPSDSDSDSSSGSESKSDDGG